MAFELSRAGSAYACRSSGEPTSSTHSLYQPHSLVYPASTHGMASVLTMTLSSSQTTRTPSPSLNPHSQRNSMVSSAASFHTAPSFGSRSSLKSSSRSSSANTLSAAVAAQGTDPVNPIHVLSEDTQQHAQLNGSLPEDQAHVVKVGAHSVRARSGPLPEPLHTKVGRTLSQVSDAFPQKHTKPGRPYTPPQHSDSTFAENSGSPSTPRSKSGFNHDVDTPRKILSRSEGTPKIRHQASTDTGVSFGSTVHSASTSVPVAPRKFNGIIETRSDLPGRPLEDTDMITSSSLPTRTPLADDAYLHPSSAAAATPHFRPARRNTTGSVIIQPPLRPSRQLTGGHKHHTSMQPTPEVSNLLDSDILEQADQIRRERLSKRAKAQQEAEAALTRAHSKKGVVDEEKVLVGNLIGEDHVNYVLMYNMLTGIRIGVSRCQAKVKRPLTDEDFTGRHKFSFDM